MRKLLFFCLFCFLVGPVMASSILVSSGNRISLFSVDGKEFFGEVEYVQVPNSVTFGGVCGGGLLIEKDRGEIGVINLTEFSYKKLPFTGKYPFCWEGFPNKIFYLKANLEKKETEVFYYDLKEEKSSFLMGLGYSFSFHSFGAPMFVGDNRFVIYEPSSNANNFALIDLNKKTINWFNSNGLRFYFSVSKNIVLASSLKEGDFYLYDIESGKKEFFMKGGKNFFPAAFLPKNESVFFVKARDTFFHGTTADIWSMHLKEKKMKMWRKDAAISPNSAIYFDQDLRQAFELYSRNK